MGSRDVVVWESFDDMLCCWSPYDEELCTNIEKAYHLYVKNNDMQYEKHKVDRNRMIDFSTNEEMNSMTGAVQYRPVHRLTFHPDSAFGKQVIWQWDLNGGNHTQWVPYPAEVINSIEEIFTRGKKSKVNLAKKFQDFNYTIDFNKNAQVNNFTKFERKVQRFNLQGRFPEDLLQATINFTGMAAAPSSSTSSAASASSAISTSTVVTPELAKYCKAELKPPDEDCCICMSSLREESAYASHGHGSSSSYATVLMLTKCKHVFHSDCLEASFKNNVKKVSLTCPYCKTIYGTKTGTQPTTGSMTHAVMQTPLPGYTGCGTIKINYNFRNGIQGPEHPNPGQPYCANSFPRIAYLPNNQEGRKILALLQVAWKRRLIFTVGRSVTTGRDNTITWNEIHHKTEMNNHSGHGYPDPNYLANVLGELKDQGVTEEDIEEQR